MGELQIAGKLRMLIGTGLLLALAGGGAQGQEAAPRAALEGVGASTPRGTSRATIVHHRPLLHTCQILPLDTARQLVAPEDARRQARQALENLERLLVMGETPRRPVAKLNVYLRDATVLPAVQQEIQRAFASQQPPPAVSYVATELPVAQAAVALDAVVVGYPGAEPSAGASRVQLLGNADSYGGRTGAAAASLPVGPRVYISGQAEKGDGTLRGATRMTLQSLLETLDQLGLDRDDVVQFKAFLTPMARIGDVEAEVAALYPGRLAPPLVCVEWQASLPVEIEVVARAQPAPERPAVGVEYITPPGLTASPLFSRVARVDHPTTIYVSGLWGSPDPADASEPLAPEAEIRSVFKQLDEILGESHSDLRHLVKATYYVAGETSSSLLNQLRPEYYDPHRPPAASKAMVAATGIPHQRWTLDMIAVPR